MDFLQFGFQEGGFCNKDLTGAKFEASVMSSEPNSMKRAFLCIVIALTFLVCATAQSSLNGRLTIDTTISASNGIPNGLFGNSVALDGNRLVVGFATEGVGGRPRQGSVYVYTRSADGWFLEQILVAPDGESGDEFGHSVSISDDTIVVGAWTDDVGTNANQGSAYVFVRSGGTWTPQQKLTRSLGREYEFFGNSVAIDQNRVAIGVYGLSTNGPEIGAVAVFTRSGTVWTFEGPLLGDSDPSVYDGFGQHVAIRGDTIVVGVPFDDVSSQVDRGSAHVFRRSGSVWVHRLLNAPDLLANDFFGSNVSINGQTIVVGSPGDDIGSATDQGSARIFVNSGNDNWVLQQKIIANDGASGDFFGPAVVEGDSVIVSARGNDVDADQNRGSCYLFHRIGTNWKQSQKITIPDGEAGDGFGSPLAISSEYVVAASLGDDIEGNLDQGSVTVFFRRASARPLFDFDGDGKSEVSIFRPSNGQWWLNRSSDGLIVYSFGNVSDTIVPADYTGDGKSDAAIWRNGEWFILRSEDGSFFSFPFGTNGDVPVPADYDGDGKADAAVFRPSNATWYIQRSSGGTTIESFGASTDRPVPADYDGDGKSDIAIYRPSLGQWWINNSSAGVIVNTFGNNLDKTVRGDFTGDGKSDVAIWRPSTGEWFVLRSEDASFYSFPFGSNGDIPVPGDYDGDGRTDAGVFRPSNATWYMNRSTNGFLIQGFGLSTDVPVPSVFVW